MTYQKPGKLTIQKIETEALRIPLKRIYKGSKYSMQNRCTIITRVYTDQGVVGEVYTGDTDKEQVDILNIINNELAPAVIGRDVFDTEGCWESMKPATYDILRALTDAGLVRCTQIPGHPARYETERHDNHHHFVCRRCGTIRDVVCTVGTAPCMDPQLPEDYDTQEAAVTFWGLCPDCRTEAPAA